MQHRSDVISTLFLLVIFISGQTAANNEEPKLMNDNPDISPENLAYISGTTPPESLQFDFLIGMWDVKGERTFPDGRKMKYLATWEARYINDKRMIMDDFRNLSPDGKDISSYVTLRSYSPATKRWELAGLPAMSPAHITHEWYGLMEAGDMILTATGITPDGRAIISKFRFYDISKQQFSWESTLSFDDGKTWVRNSALIALRSY
ncbi:MAG: hypothetical protein K6L81_09530 [Agarilytica sp.]